MPKPRKYVRHKGKTVDGVSWSNDGGYYIIRDGKRQYFGKGDLDLWRAKAAYNKLTIAEPMWVLPEGSQTREELLSMGMPEDLIDAHPELIEAQRYSRLNPEYGKGRTSSEVNREILTEMFGPREAAVWESQRNSTNPDGRILTITQVGVEYRKWYLAERGCDIEALQAQAEEQRQALAEEITRLRKIQKQPRQAIGPSIKRDGPSRKRQSRITALNRRMKRLSFVDLLDPPRRNVYREHVRNFEEFTAFIKARHQDQDISVAQISGEDLRAYFSAVTGVVAKRKLGDKWRNARFQSVTTAFRRVKKLFPEAAWPQGFFGEDGTLAILEQKNTATEGQKTLITPGEFNLLLAAADTQWRAVLDLALNCALENRSIAEIEWRHIDFDKRLMIFPRPKTKRIRQTPLLDPTLAALRQWQEESGREEGKVFLTWHGGQWLNGTDSVGKHFDLLKAKVLEQGGPSIPATFKSLRKTAASTVSRVVKDERAVDFLLGHAPNKSWRHYVAFAPDFLWDAVRAIELTYFSQGQ